MSRVRAQNPFRGATLRIDKQHIAIETKPMRRDREQAVLAGKSALTICFRNQPGVSGAEITPLISDPSDKRPRGLAPRSQR